MIEAVIAQLIEEATGAAPYPVSAPKSASAPFCIYQRVSTPREYSLGGPVGFAWPTYRVDLYSLKFDEVRLLAKQVREKLDGYQTETVSIRLVNETDLSDLTTNPDLFRVNLELRVGHQE